MGGLAGHVLAPQPAWARGLGMLSAGGAPARTATKL